MNEPHKEVLKAADAQIPCGAWRIWGHSASVISAVWSWELAMKTMNILKAGLLFERHLINFLCLHEGQIWDACNYLWIARCYDLYSAVMRKTLVLYEPFSAPFLHALFYSYLYCLLICLIKQNCCDFHASKAFFSPVSTLFTVFICWFD